MNSDPAAFFVPVHPEADPTRLAIGLAGPALLGPGKGMPLLLENGKQLGSLLRQAAPELEVQFVQVLLDDESRQVLGHKIRGDGLTWKS